MFTASFLSILALLATTNLAAPIARPDAGAVYVTDNVVVYVTVTAGQEPAVVPAATSSPVAAPVQQANGKLQVAPVAAPVTTSSIAAPVTTSSKAAPSTTSNSNDVLGGVFAAVQSSTKPSTAAAPSTTAKPSNVAAPSMNIESTNGEYVTVYVQNNLGSAVSYSHGLNTATNGVAVPAPSGNPTSGSIADGDTYSFAVPQGWAGRLSLNDAQYGSPATGNSLIEGSYMEQDFTYAGKEVNTGFVSDIDASFVDGFSVPLSCEYAATKSVIGGCTTDLWSQSISCPAKNPSGGACLNTAGPLTSTTSLTQVASFFQACGGSAYLFSTDDNRGNSGNSAGEGTILCTIGYT